MFDIEKEYERIKPFSTKLGMDERDTKKQLQKLKNYGIEEPFYPYRQLLLTFIKGNELAVEPFKILSNIQEKRK